MEGDGTRFRVDVLRPDASLQVLELSGELDLNSAGMLRRAISDRPTSSALVLDLRKLTVLDSTGLSLVLNTHAQSQTPPSWRFGLIPGPPPVQRVLEVAGVAQLLKFVDAPDEVLR